MHKKQIEKFKKKQTITKKQKNTKNKHKSLKKKTVKYTK